jgi:hypothetical protein
MVVVADFEEVIGDRPQRIGDSGARVWEGNFTTGGRYHRGPVVLMFEVQGLTDADQGVVVSVNGRDVGRIHPYEGASKNFHTQMISFPASLLKEQGNNVVQIEAIEFDGSSLSNLYDDFDLTNMILFYHQVA